MPNDGQTAEDASGGDRVNPKPRGSLLGDVQVGGVCPCPRGCAKEPRSLWEPEVVIPELEPLHQGGPKGTRIFFFAKDRP